jgi:hypothetical protein
MHLGLEELESRSLLAANPLSAGLATLTPIDSQPGQGALIGGGFPTDLIAFPTLAASGGAGLAGFNSVGGFALFQAVVANTNAAAPQASSSAPSAFDGVGQMTIATGANTIGMTAWPTSGI